MPRKEKKRKKKLSCEILWEEKFEVDKVSQLLFWFPLPMSMTMISSYSDVTPAKCRLMPHVVVFVHRVSWLGIIVLLVLGCILVPFS